MSKSTGLVTEGYLDEDGIHLVVPDCPYCHEKHWHGAADHAVGQMTHRASHCGKGGLHIRIKNR
jgi:hypothetical protein